MDLIKRKLQDHKVPFEEGVSLKKKTWIKTGGLVSLWIAPKTLEQLEDTIRILIELDAGFEIVGHTSNIYYVDDYNPNIIVSTLHVNRFIDADDYIICDCGVSVMSLSRHCVDKGYLGYYGLVNLPGTVGAAICNNSSCFDCCISQHIVEATFFDFNTREIKLLHYDDFNFSYRNSKLKKRELKGIILSIKLDKINGNVDEEKVKAAEVTYIRKTTQNSPAYTLGSIFAGLSYKKNFLTYVALGGGVKC